MREHPRIDPEGLETLISEAEQKVAAECGHADAVRLRTATRRLHDVGRNRWLRRCGEESVAMVLTASGMRATVPAAVWSSRSGRRVRPERKLAARAGLGTVGRVG
jgi:hypothetical protein